MWAHRWRDGQDLGNILRGTQLLRGEPLPEIGSHVNVGDIVSPGRGLVQLPVGQVNVGINDVGVDAGKWKLHLCISKVRPRTITAFANHVYPVDRAEPSVTQNLGQYRIPFTELFGPERLEQVKV